ncbi:type I DNA topoisomerase [Patescibacteria group bacterium]|nr:type I DNA topoisomerase [Patescibacteria group bacterium]
MNLIVVESPTKARTLSRFLGKDYDVEATMGHIKDLPKSKLGVDTENDFAPDYAIVNDKNKYIKNIQKVAKAADNIYLATDPDREGEAIAQHVKEILEGYSTKRIVFHEITKGAVKQALKTPKDVNVNLVDAQIARRVLDRLVGYKLSPLLWKKVRRGLSAGRVQTVTVRLIVEREREIKAFTLQEYWEIYCNLKTKKREDKKTQEFIAKLTKIGDKRTEVKNKKQADGIVSSLEVADYKVSDVKKREVKKQPLPPYTTSTLTQAAASSYSWSVKRTMTIAQRLYEKGLITYHRTDSTNVSKNAISKVRDFIKTNYGDKYLPGKPRFYKTKSKVAQEAHEAIRPTKVKKVKVDDKRIKEAGKLYSLIWRRFVASQMAESVYDEIKIEVEALRRAQGEQSKYLLRAGGQIMKFDGWRAVFDRVESGKLKVENGGAKLPDVKEGEALDLISVLADQKFTQPPPRYGEGSLVKTLEALGIGRPSTYAPTISTIQIRNYVEKKEAKFHPTPVGIAVNDFLIKYFPKIFEYEFTADMENELDNIANGKREWQKMMGEFYKPFDKKLENVTEKAKRVKIETEKLGKKCPTCKKEGRTAKLRGELVIRVGRFGKFVSCSNFPECKHTEKYLEKIGMKCPDCGKGDVIIKKTGKGRQFYGCSRYPKCNFASWRKPKLPKK